MDEFVNAFGLIAGVVVGVLSATFAFVNRGRYKTLITDIYEPGNKELRAQLADERSKNADIEKDLKVAQAQLKEKDAQLKQLKELVTRLPDFAKLTDKFADFIKQSNQNHTSIAKEITGLGSKIAVLTETLAGKVDSGGVQNGTSDA